jgi:hypothetical protein
VRRLRQPLDPVRLGTPLPEALDIRHKRPDRIAGCSDRDLPLGAGRKSGVSLHGDLPRQTTGLDPTPPRAVARSVLVSAADWVPFGVRAVCWGRRIDDGDGE